MKKGQTNIIFKTYRTLQNLFDPSTEGNPYETERYLRFDPNIKGSTSLLARRQLAWRNI